MHAQSVRSIQFEMVSCFCVCDFFFFSVSTSHIIFTHCWWLIAAHCALPAASLSTAQQSDCSHLPLIACYWSRVVLHYLSTVYPLFTAACLITTPTPLHHNQHVSAPSLDTLLCNPRVFFFSSFFFVERPVLLRLQPVERPVLLRLQPVVVDL